MNEIEESYIDAPQGKKKKEKKRKEPHVEIGA